MSGRPDWQHSSSRRVTIAAAACVAALFSFGGSAQAVPRCSGLQSIGGGSPNTIEIQSCIEGNLGTGTFGPPGIYRGFVEVWATRRSDAGGVDWCRASMNWRKNGALFP